MAANININLAGLILQVIDNAVAQSRVSSNIGTLSLSGSEATHIDYMPIAGGAGTILTLPVATIFALIVRNLGGVNSTPAGNIQVLQQATGGALPSAANSPLYPPGGLHVYFCTAETAGGLTAVTLIASIANTPVEILMAA